ncbi:MAG: epoxyqueuosine reductase QueH [Candidatus Woesebacteria bacterium]|jgi:predicted adenine nucleotide alpha hydrolase (AANH) superfamily ATPase
MLLLHSCCADCTIKFLKSLEYDSTAKVARVALFFYNPNIHPRSEYLSRLAALKNFFANQKLKVIIFNWRPSEYFKKIIKLKDSQENKKIFIEKKDRCPLCWHLRLEKAFQYAKEHDYQELSSTLLSSSYQNQKKILAIAKKLAKKYKVK